MIEYVDCAWRNPLEQTGDNTAKEMHTQELLAALKVLRII